MVNNMKRERIEDLGVIKNMLESLLDAHEDLFHECKTKHQRDSFIERYSNPKHTEYLFISIKNIEEQLIDILTIANGYDEE